MRIDRFSLAVLAALIAPLAALAADPAPKPAAPQAQRPAAAIDGFRSARFGMDEAAVKKSITVDFAIKDDKVRRDLHPTEKTTVLTIGAENLLPDTGPAIVSYILGFTSQKLTQVNVMWPQSAGANLASAAMVLRNHFLGQEFRSDSVIANVQLSDGSLLAFRGIDQKGRMVTVTFHPTPQQQGDGKDAKTDKPREEAYLRLSYVETPDKPDVFVLEPGQF